MKDVQFYEVFEEEEAALRRLLPARVGAGYSRGTIREVGDREPPARIISIRTQSVVPVEWAGSLRGVVSRTTGYDHLVGMPVACGYLPHYCSRAVAEHAAMALAALLRRLPRQLAQFARFERDGLTGREWGGLRVLVVGVGHVGSEVVRIARAMGMDARGVDLVRRETDVEYVALDDGLAWADAIVCAMNLTAENAGMFDEATLLRARPGVLFVNVARGEHARTADLVRLLDSGHLGGVALDVYEDEKNLAVAMRAGGASFPLIGRSDVILTPHNAFNTVEALERKARQTVEQVVHFLERGVPLWPVPGT